MTLLIPVTAPASASGGSVGLVTVIITAVVTAVISVTSSLLLVTLTFRFVRQKEMAQQLQDSMKAKAAELDRQLDNKRIELEQSVQNEIRLLRTKRALTRQERIDALLHSAAGPLGSAAEELQARLRNILSNQGYVQLDRNWDQRRPVNWSSTHGYFTSSSVYVFANYFARVEILRDRLGADEHAARGQPLMAALNDVARALSSWPAPYTSGCPGWDTQVFTWQQRALGQVLRTGGSDATHVMTYAEYLAEQGTVEQHAQPLTRLLVDISPSPEGNCRWQRLLAVQTALGIVQAQCENLVIQRDGSGGNQLDPG